MEVEQRLHRQTELAAGALAGRPLARLRAPTRALAVLLLFCGVMALGPILAKLVAKLDQLTSFQYAPKPHKTEMEVRANTGALALEEKTPLAVATGGAALAPEEVHAAPKRGGVANAELSQAERKAQREASRDPLCRGPDGNGNCRHQGIRPINKGPYLHKLCRGCQNDEAARLDRPCLGWQAGGVPVPQSGQASWYVVPRLPLCPEAEQEEKKTIRTQTIISIVEHKFKI